MGGVISNQVPDYNVYQADSSFDDDPTSPSIPIQHTYFYTVFGRPDHCDRFIKLLSYKPFQTTRGNAFGQFLVGSYGRQMLRKVPDNSIFETIDSDKMIPTYGVTFRPIRFDLPTDGISHELLLPDSSISPAHLPPDGHISIPSHIPFIVIGSKHRNTSYCSSSGSSLVFHRWASDWPDGEFPDSATQKKSPIPGIWGKPDPIGFLTNSRIVSADWDGFGERRHDSNVDENIALGGGDQNTEKQISIDKNVKGKNKSSTTKTDRLEQLQPPIKWSNKQFQGKGSDGVSTDAQLFGNLYQPPSLAINVSGLIHYDFDKIASLPHTTRSPTTHLGHFLILNLIAPSSRICIDEFVRDTHHLLEKGCIFPLINCKVTIIIFNGELIDQCYILPKEIEEKLCSAGFNEIAFLHTPLNPLFLIYDEYEQDIPGEHGFKRDSQGRWLGKKSNGSLTPIPRDQICQEDPDMVVLSTIQQGFSYQTPLNEIEWHVNPELKRFQSLKADMFNEDIVKLMYERVWTEVMVKHLELCRSGYFDPFSQPSPSSIIPSSSSQQQSNAARTSDIVPSLGLIGPLGYRLVPPSIFPINYFVRNNWSGNHLSILLDQKISLLLDIWKAAAKLQEKYTNNHPSDGKQSILDQKTTTTTPNHINNPFFNQILIEKLVKIKPKSFQDSFDDKSLLVNHHIISLHIAYYYLQWLNSPNFLTNEPIYPGQSLYPTENDPDNLKFALPNPVNFVSNPIPYPLWLNPDPSLGDRFPIHDISYIPPYSGAVETTHALEYRIATPNYTPAIFMNNNNNNNNRHDDNETDIIHPDCSHDDTNDDNDQPQPCDDGTDPLLQIEDGATTNNIENTLASDDDLIASPNLVEQSAMTTNDQVVNTEGPNPDKKFNGKGGKSSHHSWPSQLPTTFEFESLFFFDYRVLISDPSFQLQTTYLPLLPDLNRHNINAQLTKRLGHGIERRLSREQQKYLQSHDTNFKDKHYNPENENEERHHSSIQKIPTKPSSIQTTTTFLASPTQILDHLSNTAPRHLPSTHKIYPNTYLGQYANEINRMSNILTEWIQLNPEKDDLTPTARFSPNNNLNKTDMNDKKGDASKSAEQPNHFIQSFSPFTFQRLTINTHGLSLLYRQVALEAYCKLSHLFTQTQKSLFNSKFLDMKRGCQPVMSVHKRGSLEHTPTQQYYPPQSDNETSDNNKCTSPVVQSVTKTQATPPPPPPPPPPPLQINMTYHHQAVNHRLGPYCQAKLQSSHFGHTPQLDPFKISSTFPHPLLSGGSFCPLLYLYGMVIIPFCYIGQDSTPNPPIPALGQQPEWLFSSGRAGHDVDGLKKGLYSNIPTLPAPSSSPLHDHSSLSPPSSSTPPTSSHTLSSQPTPKYLKDIIPHYTTSSKQYELTAPLTELFIYRQQNAYTFSRTVARATEPSTFCLAHLDCPLHFVIVLVNQIKWDDPNRTNENYCGTNGVSIFNDSPLNRDAGREHWDEQTEIHPITQAQYDHFATHIPSLYFNQITTQIYGLLTTAVPTEKLQKLIKVDFVSSDEFGGLFDDIERDSIDVRLDIYKGAIEREKEREEGLNWGL